MWQLRVDVADLVWRQACQDVLPMGPWIESVQLRGTVQTHDGGRALTHTRLSCEQPIFAIMPTLAYAPKLSVRRRVLRW